MITKLLGSPDASFVNKIENEKNKEFVQQLPQRSGQDFNELFKDSNKQAIDLLKKMLTFDPANGVLSGKPIDKDVGNHTISLQVIDDKGAFQNQDFVITVNDV